jgi:hypothetical protein
MGLVEELSVSCAPISFAVMEACSLSCGGKNEVEYFFLGVVEFFGSILQGG